MNRHAISALVWTRASLVDDLTDYPTTAVAIVPRLSPDTSPELDYGARARSRGSVEAETGSGSGSGRASN